MRAWVEGRREVEVEVEEEGGCEGKVEVDG